MLRVITTTHCQAPEGTMHVPHLGQIQRDAAELHERLWPRTLSPRDATAE